MKQHHRIYAVHRCPRCQEATNRKDYCGDCLSTVRALPRFNFKRSEIYWNENGRRA